MIQQLSIQNFALIDQVLLEFDEGLNIITGETGAGKSILLGALDLILGGRFDNKSFYNKSQKCIVEGTFQIEKYDLTNFFKEHDFDFQGQLIVRREITPAGRSRAFINDTPTNLSVLKALSSELIDLHRQFDTLHLNQVSTQLLMIDTLANQLDKTKAYRKSYHDYVEKKKTLEELQSKRAIKDQEKDFLNFQLQELNAIELSTSEYEALDARFRQMDQAEDVLAILNDTSQALLQDDLSISNTLNKLSRQINSIKNPGKAIEDILQRIDSIKLEVENVAALSESISEEFTMNPEEKQEANNLLNQVNTLMHKHRTSDFAALLNTRLQIQSKVDSLEGASDQIEQLEIELMNLEKSLTAAAKKLSKGRKNIIPTFESSVSKMLHQLNMKQAKLLVEQKPAETLGPAGIDHLQFMVVTNKGAEPKPLNTVASGGELSRIALCAKSLVADSIPLPTLVFDEIDTGISGEVALQMGKILNDLAKRHQIISITHSPQVAARASKHFRVQKTDLDEKTQTDVVVLTDKKRITELASMLSGNPPTKAAVDNAKELMAL